MFSEQVQSRAEQRATTRRHVISIADRLFRQQGFAATSIRQIALEARVSTGTVMSVGDKSALLAAVFEASIAQRQNAQVSQHTSRGEQDAPLAPERITAHLRPFLELFSRDQELSREYAAVLVRGAHQSAIFAELADTLRAAIAIEFEASGMSHDRARTASRAVYFAYLGVLFAWAGGDSDVSTALAELQNVVSLVMTDHLENR
ncbi:TetR/AcrR family transcriptional regulator [Paramicrobacterium fandaimingii]|uniref:TetR/AcrR family transcriptional regulator n=1 Tax=Paramicrobacterium fandaimingii TaxID=2708079 RepID=UPI00142063B2|nr:TetR/AcrR family transcriptional regulator [Microbacterium fandaimingii]